MGVCRVYRANRFALSRPCLPALLLVVSWAGAAWSQGDGGIDPRGPVPSAIAPQVKALGDRLRTEGKEHMVLQGEFITPRTQSTVQVRRELSGKLLLEGFKPGGGYVSFDGDRSYGAASAADYGLLETFGQDMAEGMFASQLGSGATRLLGRRFGPDPETHPDSTGPFFDIYEVTAAVPTRPGSVTRRKRYYFNSDTGLLHSTRYNDPETGNTRVQTVFLNWKLVGGSAYPGRIERYEDGKPIFLFIVTGVSNGPKQDPEGFR